MRRRKAAVTWGVLNRFFRSLARLAASSSYARGSHAPLRGAPHPVERRVVIARDPRLRKSLGAATAEGVVAEVVMACAGGAVLTGWALHLGCSPFAIGLLAALPFIAQVLQLPAVWITSAFGKRRVAILAVGLSRVALLPLVALPFVPWSAGTKQGVLLAVTAVTAILGCVGNNAWIAWMGDLVPSPIRGRYFGRRTAICALGGAAASLGAGLVLDGLRVDHGHALAALALVAAVAGAVTTWLMRRQHDPLPEGARTALPPLRKALEPLKDRSARRWLAYLLVWNGAVGISSAFFAVHMLTNLKIGFALVAAHAAGVAAMRMLCAPLWGRVIDRMGARPVLIACTFALTTLPAMWVFTDPSRGWIVALDAVLAGALWSGHALAAFALPLSVTPREGRRFSLAIFSTGAGLAFAIASTSGGALAGALPATFELSGHSFYGLQVLFAFSSIARVGAALVALRILQPGARPLDELVPALRLELARASSSSAASASKLLHR